MLSAHLHPSVLAAYYAYAVSRGWEYGGLPDLQPCGDWKGILKQRRGREPSVA